MVFKHGVQNIQDCCNIIDKFPIKAKVVIADIGQIGLGWDDFLLENIVVKEERKPLKRVKKPFPLYYPLSGSSFLPKEM